MFFEILFKVRLEFIVRDVAVGVPFVYQFSVIYPDFDLVYTRAYSMPD